MASNNNILNLNNLNLEELYEFEKIYVENKTDFNNFINEISKSCPKNVYWLTQTFLSRNHYLSQIYLNICYLKLAKNILKKKKIELIITQNISQKKFFKKNIDIQKESLKIISYENINTIRNVATIVKAFLSNLIICLCFIFNKSSRRAKNYLSFNKNILIEIYILDTMISSGKFYDRYYNNLTDHLEKEEKSKITYIAHFLSTKNIKKKIKILNLREENYIYIFDFLKLQDYFKALTSFLHINTTRFKNLKFFDIDVENLVKEEVKKNFFNKSSFFGILNYFFFSRLRNQNIEVPLVIDWHENQPFDRGFNFGIHNFFPNTKTIGYQGYINDYNHNFYLIPTNNEIDAGVVPKKIALMGSGLHSIFLNQSKKINLINAPSFRFSNIYLDKKKKDEKDDKIILVALPISYENSLDILKLVISYLESKTVNNKIEFLLNYHPLIDIENMKSKFSNFPEKLKVTKKDFSELASKTDLIISNTSSICLESLAMEIPCIIVPRFNGITNNPIPENIEKKTWNIVYTVEELDQSINNLLYKLDRLTIKKESENIKQNYFTPTNSETVRSFLEFRK